MHMCLSVRRLSPQRRAYSFAAADAEDFKKEQKMQHLKMARQQSLSSRQDLQAAGPAAPPVLKPGDPGFRWHAMVPASARLDYLEEPKSAFEEGSLGSFNPKKTRFIQKTREVELKRKQTTQRAMQPNVEGRGMIIYS